MTGPYYEESELGADLARAHEAMRTILRSCKLQFGADGEPIYTVPFDALEAAYHIVGYPWPEQCGLRHDYAQPLT